MLREMFRRIIGSEKEDMKAHEIKNQMTRDILTIQEEVERLNRYIKKTTAYKVAKATGRIR